MSCRLLQTFLHGQHPTAMPSMASRSEVQIEFRTVDVEEIDPHGKEPMLFETPPAEPTEPTVETPDELNGPIDLDMAINNMVIAVEPTNTSPHDCIYCIEINYVTNYMRDFHDT